jgi:hypothetical protein
VTDSCHEHDGHHHHDSEGSSAPGAESALLVELREHVPFSVTAVALGLMAAGAICILGSGLMDGGFDEAIHDHALPKADDHGDHAHGPVFAQLFFHLFHPAHMLFSAVATTAMFCRYDRSAIKAVIVGMVGAIGVCGASDILMPHVSLMVLGIKTPWHICVIEHPTMVLPYAVIGVIVGMVASGGVIRSTLISHSLHVLASSMASIFYMVGPLGLVAWIDRVGQVFVFVVLAVMVPCCLSDIVFPLLMSRAGRSKYAEEPHSCH